MMAETFKLIQASIRQKILLGGVTLGVIAAIVGLISLVNKLTYGTLFSNPNSQDASAYTG